MNLQTENLSGELEGDLQFETLIADLSSKFINLTADEVDREIEGAQRCVCEILDLDLSALWQPVDETLEDYQLTHHYRFLEGPLITRMRAKENFPWCHQQPLAGNVIAVSSMDALPPEAARDQEAWRHFGIKTSLTLSLIDRSFHEICGTPSGRRQDLQPLRIRMEHLHPDDRQYVLEQRQTRQGAKVDPFSIEYRYLHPSDGEK